MPHDLAELCVSFPGPESDFVAGVRRMGGEGVVAKRLDSLYQPGKRTGAWVPTCVGIGETKTKAKLANFLAKKRPEFAGVCDLRDAAACQRLYPTIPLDQVWGIGGASAAELQALGLATVADLAAFDVTKGTVVLTVTGRARHHGIAGHVLPAAVADLAAT